MQSILGNAMLIVGVAVILWLVLIQPLLKRRPEVDGLVEDPNLSFLDRVRLRLKGLKTKLVARLVVLLGGLVTVHDLFAPALAGYNWAKLIPPQYADLYPLVLIVLGVLFDQLRNATTTPPGVSELPKDIEQKIEHKPPPPPEA